MTKKKHQKGIKEKNLLLILSNKILWFCKYLIVEPYRKRKVWFSFISHWFNWDWLCAFPFLELFFCVSDKEKEWISSKHSYLSLLVKSVSDFFLFVDMFVRSVFIRRFVCLRKVMDFPPNNKSFHIKIKQLCKQIIIHFDKALKTF